MSQSRSSVAAILVENGNSNVHGRKGSIDCFNYDGFNLELTSVGQYLTFTFGQNMQNDDYSIIVNGDEKSSGTIWNLLFPSNPATAKAVDAFDVTLVELNETGPTISEELFSGGSGTGSVIVIGRQDT